MTAAIYARVSTRDKGQDPENQLRELRLYCERAGWTVYDVYVDQSSGKNGDREEFQRLFRDATERRFDVVVTWALDRFSREGISKTFEYVERLLNWGVRFESFTEPHFRTTGPAAELMMAVAAWIAKQERERIRERVIAGVRKAQTDGKHCGRPRKVFSRERLARLRDQGMTWRAIASELGLSTYTAQYAYQKYQTERTQPDAQ